MKKSWVDVFLNVQLYSDLFWVRICLFHGYLYGFPHTDNDDRIDAACDLKSPRCKEVQGEWKIPKRCNFWSILNLCWQISITQKMIEDVRRYHLTGRQGTCLQFLQNLARIANLESC